MISVKRSAFRYHGGKFRIGKWIISHFPDHHIYVEPYGGAASVLLQKKRSYAEVYNDLNEEVVNFFRVLRDPEKTNELITQLKLTPFSRSEFNLSYEQTGQETDIEKARLFAVKCQMGFGTTSIRKSRTGFRSHPFRKTSTGVDDWISYPESLLSIANRMQGVIIEKKPAIEVISKNDTDKTLFYIDPPYMFETRSSVKKYGPHRYAYSHEMTDDDHVNLSLKLHDLKGMCIISHYRCDLYDSLYSSWHRVDKSTMADGAKKRIESLWINPECLKQVPQPELFKV